MLFGFISGHDVEDGVTGGLEIIRDERAMTLPPQRFRAHDGGPLVAGEVEQSIDSRAKFRGHHEICVAAKGFVAPGVVGRIGQGLAASAEFGKMNVFDAGRRQGFGKIFLAKMWEPARAGKTADIGEQLNLLGSQQLEKLLEGAV